MKDKIAQLKKQRADIQARVAELAALEGAGTDLSAEQLTEFQTLQAEFDGLTAKINRLEAAESMAAATAQPVRQVGVVAVERSERPKGFALGAIVQSLAACGGDPRAAANFADQTLHAPDIAAALNTTTNSAGGYIIPPGYVPELIELLRPASVVRRMGARSMPMPNGTLTLPKLAGGSTASYGSEGLDATKSEQSFGDLKLSKKKLTALVPISNDLIRFSNPESTNIVTEDMIAGIATREDKAFMLDNGTGDLPKGLRHWCQVGNQFAANATINLANVRKDLGKLRLALKNGHVRMLKPGYLLSARSEEFLLALVDGNGNLAFPEMAQGRIGSIPYACSTQIPDDEGTGDDESLILLTDFADAIIGEATGLIIDISKEASYVEGGNLVSAFSRDQTVVRAITEHDFGMRHDASVAMLTGVKWEP